MRLHSTNVTSFGKQVVEWYWARDSEIFVFIETHLDKQQHDSVRQYFTIRGRQVSGMAVTKNETNEGAREGIMTHDPLRRYGWRVLDSHIGQTISQLLAKLLSLLQECRYGYTIHLCGGLEHFSSELGSLETSEEPPQSFCFSLAQSTAELQGRFTHGMVQELSSPVVLVCGLKAVSTALALPCVILKRMLLNAGHAWVASH